MNDLAGWQRVFLGILTLALMLNAASRACVDELERWLDQLIAQLIQELVQAIRDWVNQLIADVQQAMVDWWEGLQRDVAQAWDDFWHSIRPPAPVITAPPTGLAAPGQAITVRGAAVAGSTVGLMRNG